MKEEDDEDEDEGPVSSTASSTLRTCAIYEL